jgi:predicted transcriptional regulator
LAGAPDVDTTIAYGSDVTLAAEALKAAEDCAVTANRIQSWTSLREEMKAVAKGERKAPPSAGRPSFDSVEALLRLLTPENRALLALMRDSRPRSLAELAELSGRTTPNVTRTIGKLVAAGFVEVKVLRHRKVAVPLVKRLKIEIDPFSQTDLVEFE